MILYEKKFVSCAPQNRQKTILSPFGDYFVPFGDNFIINKLLIKDEAIVIFTSYAYDATAHPKQNRWEEASGAYRLHDW